MIVDEQERILFLHIPKTAGTTLIQILQCSFRTSDSFRFSSEAEVFRNAVRRAELIEGVKGYQFLAGHVPYGNLGELRDRFSVVTVLRHPVERVNSLHRFYCDPRQTASSHAESARLAWARSCGVAEFAECMHPLVRPEVNNGMCRLLVDREQSEIETMDEVELFVEARATLGKCQFGMTENLECFLRLLGSRYGCYIPEVIPVANASRKQRAATGLSRDDYDRIVRVNLADMLLVEWARAEFARRYESWCDVETLERSANSAIPQLSPAGDGRTFTWDCDGLIFGGNWHEVERSNEGQLYRFTGPGNRSTLWFRISPEVVPLEVSLLVLFASEPGILDGTRLEINGTSVSCRPRYVEGRGLYLEADIPFGTASHQGILKLSIITPYVVCPASHHAGSGDQRRLGIACAQVSVKAVSI